MQSTENLVFPPKGFNGTRSAAFSSRDLIENFLDEGASKVLLDLSGVEGTQGFVDELVGRLVVERGQTVVARLGFRNCSDNMKALIRFVLSDRAEQVRNRAESYA